MEMCSRNNNKVINNPVGSAEALIFDIDHCLYHSKELMEHELLTMSSMLSQFSAGVENDLYKHMDTYHLFREIFFRLFGIHPAEFSCKYELPEFEKYFIPDPELRSMLESLDCRKFCFTNGQRDRAARILRYLGLEHIFELVICADVDDTEFICKPQPHAFAFVERYLGIADRSKVFFFDDSLKNIEAAKVAGWNAYLVDGDIKAHLKGRMDVKE